MQARDPFVADALADVLREIAGRHARLLQRTRPDRQVTDQLDVRNPAAPDVSDQPLLDVTADREVHVQAVPTGMPLRCPRVRQRLPAQLPAKAAEELRDIDAQ